MGYDLKRSHFSLVLEKEVLAGSVITEEGVLLVSVLDSATGTEKVSASTGTGSEVVAGFAIRDNADHATTSEVESVTIPSATPYEVQLRQNNLVSGDGDGAEASLSAMLDTSGTITQMDNLDTAAGAVAGDVVIDVPSGLLTFHSDDAGKPVVVTYRYNLTVAESRLKFYQRNINNEASTLFSQVGVGQGHGEIFTDQFDAAVDWSVAGAPILAGGSASTVPLGDGTLTTTGNGSVTLDARVISVPNVNNPLLGISFDIGGATG